MAALSHSVVRVDKENSLTSLTLQVGQDILSAAFHGLFRLAESCFLVDNFEECGGVGTVFTSSRSVSYSY